jgi:predicted  nucleic acid-binding Zn-ribbon protein
LDAYIQGTQLPNGEYAHLLICSGDRSKPAGESGCVCAPRIKRLRAEVSRLHAEREFEKNANAATQDSLRSYERNISELSADVSRLQHRADEAAVWLSAVRSALGDDTLNFDQLPEAVSRLQQENALLRRSLEMLTKQLDERDRADEDAQYVQRTHD